MDIGDWSYGDLLDTAAGQRRRIAELEAENARLREALEQIAEGSTPWIDGYHKELWEVLAAYAKLTLLGGGE